MTLNNPANNSRGMAHFAATGPVGKTCADCAHLRPALGKMSYCSEYQRLTRDKKTTITGYAQACNKFVAKPSAPPPKPVAPPPRPTLPQKICAMPTCKRHVDSWAQFCAYHWFGLPDTHQQRVTAARKEEAPALADAVTAAVRWLQTEGDRP